VRTLRSWQLSFHSAALVQSGSSATTKVPVTAYCIAFALELPALQEELEERFGSHNVRVYPEDLKASQTADIVFARYMDDDTGEVCGDVFYFEARASAVDLHCMLLSAFAYPAPSPLALAVLQRHCGHWASPAH
jgi:hypothetical protein